MDPLSLWDNVWLATQGLSLGIAVLLIFYFLDRISCGDQEYD